MNNQAQTCTFDKARFKPDYCFMQTSLDRPKIIQIYQFMEHAKASYLDLQLILPKKSTTVKNIQKTIIFIHSVSDIHPIIYIIVGQMKKLGYPDPYSNWIRPYYSTMSDWDKDLIANIFQLSGDKNMEYTILVVTDVYDMGIDNPDS